MNLLETYAILDSISDRLEDKCFNHCEGWQGCYQARFCPVSCSTARIWYRILQEYDDLRVRERMHKE